MGLIVGAWTTTFHSAKKSGHMLAERPQAGCNRQLVELVRKCSEARESTNLDSRMQLIHGTFLNCNLRRCHRRRLPQKVLRRQLTRRPQVHF